MQSILRADRFSWKTVVRRENWRTWLNTRKCISMTGMNEQGCERRETGVQKRRTAIEEIVSDALRQWEEDGDLRRLAGQSLDLDDDSPDWFTNRMLKREGFTHPALERGKDVDELRAEVDRAEECVLHHAARRSPHPAEWRSHEVIRRRLLSEFRAAIVAFNNAVLAYNIGVPDVLHKRSLALESFVAALDKATAPSLHPWKRE